MKVLLTSYCLLFLSNLNAQSEQVSGLWEGFLALHQQRYPIEMNIHVEENGVLSGFTSVSLPDGKVIEMKVRGKLHLDRSVTVHEFTIVNKEELTDIDWYQRNFQLVFKRDLWEMTLEGFWQEQVPHIVDDRTRRGRIFLKKREVKA